MSVLSAVNFTSTFGILTNRFENNVELHPVCARSFGYTTIFICKPICYMDFFSLNNEFVFSMTKCCLWPEVIDISYTVSTIDTFSSICTVFERGSTVEAHEAWVFTTTIKKQRNTQNSKKTVLSKPNETWIDIKTSNEIEWRSPMRTVQVA